NEGNALFTGDGGFTVGLYSARGSSHGRSRLGSGTRTFVLTFRGRPYADMLRSRTRARRSDPASEGTSGFFSVLNAKVSALFPTRQIAWPRARCVSAFASIPSELRSSLRASSSETRKTIFV